MNADDFVQLLSTFPKFLDFGSKRSNSLAFCASYLLDKLNNRVKKAKDKLTSIYLEHLKKNKSAEIEAIHEIIKSHEHDASYLSCLSLQYQKSRFEEVKERVQQG